MSHVTITWPNSSLPYEYPADTTENQTRWQSALDQSLGAGRGLEMTQKPGSQSLFNLRGGCPRCGHSMSKEVEIGVIFGVQPVQRFSRTNVDCNCNQEHDGRDDKHEGCGIVDIGLGVPDS